ncbi:hypothetical protein ONS95_013615 [Cadophora gregata]|uniref:uncharacterized protein n=1 Tax=Cadophora gregata TaxID=51156 RepID=UPI0026DCC569|nr:uncharacterized protein ONS95_013615 [Cadophora gregata]KAK0114111.1 hypothetical protein ONS95_013615 [Cadophora gregata]
MAAPPSPISITPSRFQTAQETFTLHLPPTAFQPNGPTASTAFITPAQIFPHLPKDVITILTQLHASDNKHPRPPLYDLVPDPHGLPSINERGELELKFRVDRNHAAANEGWLRNPVGLVGMQSPVSWSGLGLDYDIKVYLAGLWLPMTAERYQKVFRDIAAFRQLAPY